MTEKIRVIDPSTEEYYLHVYKGFVDQNGNKVQLKKKAPSEKSPVSMQIGNQSVRMASAGETIFHHAYHGHVDVDNKPVRPFTAPRQSEEEERRERAAWHLRQYADPYGRFRLLARVELASGQPHAQPALAKRTPEPGSTVYRI